LKKYLYKYKRKIQLYLLTKKRLHYKSKERTKHYGKEHVDKTFYVIGVDEGWCGLFAIVTHQLTHIAYAIEKGYTPIVDLKNYHSQYISFDDRFHYNSWEFFFEQPCGYDLKDLKKARKVIYSVSYFDPPNRKYLMPYETIVYDSEKINYWSALFKSYIRINNEVRKGIEERTRFLFMDKKHILGVLLRGTDYLTLKPSRHPIQPNLQDAIVKVKECFLQWGCSHIYLATEDADIYRAFQKEFGLELIYDDSNRWTQNDLIDGKSNSNLFSSTEDKINEGIKYLTQICLLSNCTSFVGGNTRGTLGVLLMTEGFENQFVFDLGLYN
jgi:hypothetical protein